MREVVGVTRLEFETGDVITGCGCVWVKLADGDWYYINPDSSRGYRVDVSDAIMDQLLYDAEKDFRIVENEDD